MNRFIRQSAAALSLAAVFAPSAFAQATGGPAFFEQQRAQSVVTNVQSVSDAQPGPYAQYLMSVNGLSKEEALRSARGIDRGQAAATAKYVKVRRDRAPS
jgi:hypothetical protein